MLARVSRDGGGGRGFRVCEITGRQALWRRSASGEMVEKARPPVIDRRYSRGLHTDFPAPPFPLREENAPAW
jgi:hypothetical protein